MKNAYLLDLQHADWNVSPTTFRPVAWRHWRRRISVIHDGVDTRKAFPIRRRRRSSFRMALLEKQPSSPS